VNSGWLEITGEQEHFGLDFITFELIFSNTVYYPKRLSSKFYSSNTVCCSFKIFPEAQINENFTLSHLLISPEKEKSNLQSEHLPKAGMLEALVNSNTIQK